MPRTGSLKVYVAGPGGKDLGAVDVYVDNQKVCSSSPCSVRELPPGIHDVHAEAKGYGSAATKGVEVSEGKDSKLEIELFEAGAGFKVTSTQPGITLHVDGKEVGSLPQQLTTLSPGEHTLRFVGSDRYEPVTRTVTVLPNKVEDLGEVKLPVAKGRATFEIATEGARLRLVSDGEPRAIDDNDIEDGRVALDIDTSKSWKLEACSEGHDPVSIPVTFGDGQAEKSFRVELEQNPAMVGGRLEDWCRRGAPKAPGKGNAVTKTPVGTTSGTLNINSIPASAAVLLDGRPVGRTPLSGLSVSAGAHSIVFIHPEKGRKAASVTVVAGQSKGVGVRF